MILGAWARKDQVTGRTAVLGEQVQKVPKDKEWSRRHEADGEADGVCHLFPTFTREGNGC